MTPSVLDPLCPSRDSLTRAVDLGRAAASCGFDWHEIHGVIDALAREVDELRQAVVAGEPPARVAEELGDVCFSFAQVARHLDLDPHAVIDQSCRKFEARFRFAERHLVQHGTSMALAGDDLREQAWQIAKEALR